MAVPAAAPPRYRRDSRARDHKAPHNTAEHTTPGTACTRMNACPTKKQVSVPRDGYEQAQPADCVSVGAMENPLPKGSSAQWWK